MRAYLKGITLDKRHFPSAGSNAYGGRGGYARARTETADCALKLKINMAARGSWQALPANCASNPAFPGFRMFFSLDFTKKKMSRVDWSPDIRQYHFKITQLIVKRDAHDLSSAGATLFSVILTYSHVSYHHHRMRQIVSYKKYYGMRQTTSRQVNSTRISLSFTEASL